MKNSSSSCQFIEYLGKAYECSHFFVTLPKEAKSPTLQITMSFPYQLNYKKFCSYCKVGVSDLWNFSISQRCSMIVTGTHSEYAGL